MAQSNGKPPLKILLIEDNHDDVLLVVNWLREDWHPIWKRVENEAGLLLALDESWDIILCDIKMPRFSAERALAVSKEYLMLKNASPIPFIAISGHVDELEAVKLLRNGARDFIGKDRMQRLPLAIKRELRHAGELLANSMKVSEAYDGVIEAWGTALELRDFHTRGHTERVTTLSLRLAISLNVPHDQFINLNRGALLHDIGKMGIPDAILLKRDYLTPEEMRIMKKHTTIAYEMLQKIPFLKEAAVVPLYHHEQWDGSGYPQGLKGNDIPFLARLFSVCDVYDALTSDRPYRKSWDKAQAIAHVLDNSEKAFDPAIVTAFVNMMGRG